MSVCECTRSRVLSELEPYADGILIDFGVQKQALFDLICGNAEPSGLLPIEFPSDMKSVEMHCEDLPLTSRPIRTVRGIPTAMDSD